MSCGSEDLGSDSPSSPLSAWEILTQIMLLSTGSSPLPGEIGHGDIHPLSLLHPHLWISPWPILPSKGLDPVDDNIICVNVSRAECGDEGLSEPRCSEPHDTPTSANLSASRNKISPVSPLLQSSLSPFATAFTTRNLRGRLNPTQVPITISNRIRGITQSFAPDKMRSRHALTSSNPLPPPPRLQTLTVGACQRISSLLLKSGPLQPS